MGHTGFRHYKTEFKNIGKHSQANSPIRRNIMPPVNGLINYDDDHVQASNREREAFRDTVSKRMGELLLRGVTMLDSYCPICNGILMENKNGQQNCVTCELLAEKASEGNPALAKQIMHLGEKEVVPHSSTLQSIIEFPLNNSQDNATFSENKKQHKSPTLRAGNIALKENVGQPALDKQVSPVKCLPGYASALKAIDDKLAWAAQRLNNTDDITESRNLLNLISDAAKVLKLL